MQLKELFDYKESLAEALFEKAVQLWDPLDQLKLFIKDLILHLDRSEYKEVAPNVWAHRTALIHPSCRLEGPAIIGPGAELRFMVFLRGSVLIDKHCVLSTATECKNAILLEGATLPHYNYVGDSIMGKHAHLGAGAICSNLRGDGKNIVLHLENERIETPRRKFGAYLGDSAEVGCNSVLNPGTILGKHTQVYPLTSVRGFHAAHSVVKLDEHLV